jgi:lysophospholipase L1-like esterase
MHRGLRVILVLSLTFNAMSLAVGAMIVTHKGGIDYVLEKTGIRPPVHRPLKWQEDWTEWVRTLPEREGDVLLLGDSIIAGGQWGELFPQVRNRGLGFETTDGLLGRLDAVLRPGARKVLVQVGTNDLSSETSVDAIVENYRTILARIRQSCPHAEVGAVSVLPINTAIDDNYLTRRKQKLIPVLNAAIRELCRQTGATFVDVYNVFTNGRGELDERYTFDGLHLSQRGYGVFYTAMRPHLSAPASQLVRRHDDENISASP